jgi:3-dehydroquinate dehydratase-2
MRMACIWRHAAAAAIAAPEAAVLPTLTVPNVHPRETHEVARAQTFAPKTVAINVAARKTGAINVAVINGPNLNMLGLRQPEIYGHTTLADIEAMCVREGAALGLAVDCFQSNHEGALVDHIQACRGKRAGIVINPGAYTHTSVAILDALMAAEVPFIELHLSNIHRRESFRHHSYLSPAASGVILGLGVPGYGLALRAVATLVAQAAPAKE